VVAFVHTNSELAEKEVRKAIPFIVSKNMHKPDITDILLIKDKYLEYINRQWN
jgi:hypothetical protein